jgi:hypothetical protein
VTVILLGVCAPMAGFPQGQPASVCDTVRALQEEISEQGQQIVRMRQRYTEKHPEMQRARARLAEAEMALAAERAKAASQGLDCSATESKPG